MGAIAERVLAIFNQAPTAGFRLTAVRPRRYCTVPDDIGWDDPSGVTRSGEIAYESRDVVVPAECLGPVDGGVRVCGPGARKLAAHAPDQLVGELGVSLAVGV